MKNEKREMSGLNRTVFLICGNLRNLRMRNELMSPITQELMGFSLTLEP